jgi:rhodanese-related sulfurtransferase
MSAVRSTSLYVGWGNKPLYELLTELLLHLPEDFCAASAGDLHRDLPAQKDVFLLDVRRAEQYRNEGHIGSAVNVPFEVLFSSLDKLPPKDTSIVVCCTSGNRSSVAVLGLRLLGYRHTTNLDGGLSAWMGAGLPLVAVAPQEKR